jgi:hypothetical protein
VAAYIVLTIPAAVIAEEAHLRARFGADWQAYLAGGGATGRFSLARARANREPRTIAGLLAAFALLALKAELL